MSTPTTWHAWSAIMQGPLARRMAQSTVGRQLPSRVASYSTKSVTRPCPSTLNSFALNTRSAPFARQSLCASAVRYLSSSSKPANGSSLSGQTPPGTFATGSKWDLVDTVQTSGATNHTRSDKITGAEHEEEPQGAAAVMEANLKKLQAIEKATRRRQAYSPYVLLSRLPPTVMPDDIKRMAKAEDDIVAIIYHRNDYMGFLGKATVVFKSATTATEFLTQHFGKFMSGHRLSMTMLDPFNNNDKSLIPPQMQPATFSGQAVLVSGLPLATRPDHLRSEFRKFNLMDTTEHAIVPVQSKKMASTCQYLIRLSSPSEAYRFVRTYHNTFYKREEYRRRCPIRATVIY